MQGNGEEVLLKGIIQCSSSKEQAKLKELMDFLFFCFQYTDAVREES